MTHSDQIIGIRNLFIHVFVFATTTIPLYSICAIHTNNLISAKQMTSLSASLIFIFAVGAIISIVLVGYLIQIFDSNAMFIYFAALYIVLLVFTGYGRASIQPHKAPRHKHVYIPRTSLFITRARKSMKRKQWTRYIVSCLFIICLFTISRNSYIWHLNVLPQKRQGLYFE